MKEKRKRMSPDRIKQVATTLERYGDQHYQDMGNRSQTFKKDPAIAKRASWMYWHPERFNEAGELLAEWEDKF